MSQLCLKHIISSPHNWSLEQEKAHAHSVLPSFFLSMKVLIITSPLFCSLTSEVNYILSCYCPLLHTCFSLFALFHSQEITNCINYFCLSHSVVDAHLSQQPLLWEGFLCFDNRTYQTKTISFLQLFPFFHSFIYSLI